MLAKKHVEEIRQILVFYFMDEDIVAALGEIKKTTRAYKENKSFRETIKALLKAYKDAA